MTHLLTPAIIILISSAIAIVWAEISPFMPWLKRYLAKKKIWYNKGFAPNSNNTLNTPARFPRRIKPFDCYQCLSFWIALFASYRFPAPTLFQYSDHIIPIATACVCCIFSIFVWKVVLKNNPIN